jgi:hypothetical protein
VKHPNLAVAANVDDAEQALKLGVTQELCRFLLTTDIASYSL